MGLRQVESFSHHESFERTPSFDPASKGVKIGEDGGQNGHREN